MSLVSANSSHQRGKSSKHPKLLDKMSNNGSLIDELLGQVYIASDIAGAIKLLPKLDKSESVITPSGVWIGQGWIRINNDNKEDGVLLREQRIQTLKTENDKFLSDLLALQQQLKDSHKELEKAEQQQSDSETRLDDLQQMLTEMQSQHTEFRTKSQTSKKRIQQIKEELELLQSREENSQNEFSSVEKMLGKTRTDQENLSAQKEKLTELQNKHREILGGARNNWQSTHEQSHEIALQLESLSSQRASLEPGNKED